MKLLVMGGTRFVGRHIVEAALARGHEVTMFNRGKKNPELFPEAERITGDRKESLEPLAGRTWDAVIDPAGYLPADVRASAEALKDSVGMYAFVSTISVYTGEGGPPNEDAPLHPADFESAEITNDTYGGLKVACEQVVQEVMAGRNLIVRPGIIVGPYDYMNRFLYWAKRIAQGGEMAAPGDPERPVQVLDVRDLAAFVLDRVEAGAGGTFNLVGPAETLTMQGMLDEMRGVTGGDASVTWVPDEFLDRDDEWKKMPLWAPADDNDLFLTSNARALAAGLMLRPLADTIRDHIAADEADPPETTPPGGFDPEREAELLAAWHAEAAAPASAASE